MTTPTRLDIRLIPKVKLLIEKYGKTVTIQRATYTYDPSTLTNTPTPLTDVEIKVTPPENYSSTEVDGDLIQADDLRVWLPSKDLDWTPAPNMHVVMDGKTFRIVQVETIYTGELIALYGLQLRR